MHILSVELISYLKYFKSVFCKSQHTPMRLVNHKNINFYLKCSRILKQYTLSEFMSSAVSNSSLMLAACSAGGNVSRICRTSRQHSNTCSSVCTSSPHSHILRCLRIRLHLPVLTLSLCRGVCRVKILGGPVEGQQNSVGASFKPN